MLINADELFAAGFCSAWAFNASGSSASQESLGYRSRCHGTSYRCKHQSKGTNTGVATDFDGKFTLSVNPGSTLIVSYIGYITKEVKVGNQTSLKIFLEEDKKLLDEVVVVGYGTMKKSDLSGSSVSVGEKAIKGSVITSLDQSLQGRAAGVTAVSTSGAPGTSLS